MKSKKNLKLLTIFSMVALISVCLVGVATWEDSNDSSAMTYTLSNETIDVGSSYSRVITGTGFISTETYTVTSPSWMSASFTSATTITVSGTPTTGGTYSVSVTGIMAQGATTGVWNWTITVQYTHTLSFNANGGSGAPATQTVKDTSSSTSITIPSDIPTRSGYTFAGWATTSGGSVSYTAGSSISVGTTAKTLYAVWQQTTYTHQLTYNANGGSGAPSSQTVTNTNSGYTSITISSTIPTYSGFIFKGWATSSTATTASYQPGGTFLAGVGTSRLYAVWEQATITISGTPEDAALVGSSYTHTPTVSVTGCTLSVDGASWLTVSGSSLVGTPTEAGTYEITLTVSKSGYTSATQTFTVVVVSVLSFESSPTGGVIAYAV